MTRHQSLAPPKGLRLFPNLPCFRPLGKPFEGANLISPQNLQFEANRVFGYYPEVSPTVFRYRSYRFFFFSREERRMHVHIVSPDGEAKFWLEPTIELAANKGLKSVELGELQRIVEERQNEIRDHWRRHFGT